MKNILTFDQFINESYGIDFDAFDGDKKAQIMDKMKAEIEAKKKAWEDVKKKAEAEGITL